MDRIRIIELFSKDKQIELIHLHINILILFDLNCSMKNITLRALLPFIGFVILCSCSNHKTADGDAQIISVDFNRYENLAMSDIISKIEIIALQGDTNSYFVSPMELRIDGGNFYFRDQHAVFAFYSKGEFLYNTKNRRGRAGNEYFSINEYTVIDGNVYIMNHDGKIVVYDPDLNLKESFQTQADGYSFGDFCMFNQDVMAFRTTTLDSIIWQFYSQTQAKTVGSCRLPCNKRGGYKFGTLSSYISNDDMVLCRLPDNGYSYYTLNPVDCSATERFRYDVGKKYTFSPSDVGEDERITSYLESHPGEFVIAQETLLNNSFILTRLGFIEQVDDFDDGRYRLSFYSLKNGHHRLINNRFLNGKWIMGIDYMDDTCIYSFENDYSYLDLLYEDSLLDEESRRILKTVNDDTNGLIIKYHLRNDILN